MNIRKTLPEDLPAVMDIFNYARKSMAENGNGNQWINGYPSRELIMEDIERGYSYVCVNENYQIAGTFCWMTDPDPNYKNIFRGEWLNNEPYGVIHRIAANGKEKGIADACLKWCFSQCGNVRMDTHKDNKVMQNIAKKYGFTYCGIIYVGNGTERLAYHKII